MNVTRAWLGSVMQTVEEGWEGIDGGSVKLYVMTNVKKVTVIQLPITSSDEPSPCSIIHIQQGLSDSIL